MTGIKERRWASEDQDTSDLAFEASKKAIEDAGITPADIDMIIVATATGDMPFPSVANILQEKLGTRKVPTMDQLAACSGFMYSMITAKQYVQSGDYKNILVVSEGRGIISYEMGSDGNGGKYLYLNKDTGKLVMNGREVFKFAVRIMGEASTRVVDKAGLQSDDIDMFIPHQANIRIMESARERLGIEREKMSVSVNRFGNTSAASIPLSISQELENGRIKDDDTLVLVGFGGGLTWGAMVIKWGK